MSLLNKYKEVRQRSEDICKPLQVEDYVVQPVVDVSPPKWHLGHTTWFFETFILKPNVTDYKEFDPNYNFVFNSYYETIGTRVVRTDRGNLSRPGVEDVYKYRKHVDAAMEIYLENELWKELHDLVLLGLNHEQQHQELLCTDIKYILGNNPLQPAYDTGTATELATAKSAGFIDVTAGICEIGYIGDGFCFDNELSRHRIYLQDYSIADALVTNAEYMQFMEAGGYTDFRHWHSEGWDWVQ